MSGLEPGQLSSTIPLKNTTSVLTSSASIPVLPVSRLKAKPANPDILEDMKLTSIMQKTPNRIVKMIPRKDPTETTNNETTTN